MDLFNKYKNKFTTPSEWKEAIVNEIGGFDLCLLLNCLKRAINYYDKSFEVNSFLYKDNKYWLDKDTRVGLFRLIDSGAETITLQLGEIYVDISADKLSEFLNKLEVYAGKCFSVTAKHLQTLNNATSIEEILALNYTEDYPDKIELTNE
jgi:hypothetical protein